MAKPVLLSLGAGKVQELSGTNDNDVLTWDADTGAWVSAPGGGIGSGTVTSVGLENGTSGLVVSVSIFDANPITTAGTFYLDAPLRFAFDTTTPTEVAAAGQVSYNTDEGSLEQMFDGGHVKSVLGQTLHQRVLNETGSTLTKGQVVYVNGAQGNRVTVDLALADADSTSATIIGLVAYAIADAAEGYVITEGVIKGVNTNGFTEGLPVYLSPTTPGALTQTKPEAPQHLVLVGYCVRADATVGEILVKTQNGYELGELHDVYINSPTSGQILIYDATAGQTRWENASLTGGTGVTVTPGAGSLTVAIGQAVGTGDSPTFSQVTTTARVSTDNLRARTAASGFSFIFIDPLSTSVPNVALQPSNLSGTPTNFYVGAGGITGASGTAGHVYLTGGGGGSGSGNGGDAYVRGGGVAGSGLTGRVFIGDSSTRSVSIGAASITTTFLGAASFASASSVTLPLTAGYVKTDGSGVVSASATVPTSDLSGTVSVANGGTNNASLSVTQGTVYYGDGTKLVGLAPGTSGHFLKTNGAGANPEWAAAGGGGSTPYDVLGRFAGNPATSAVLYSAPVPRAVTVSTTTGNHYFYASALPSSGTAVITVYKTLASDGTKSALFTATWTAGQAAAANGLYQATIGTVSNNTLVAGDVLSVEMGTTNAAFTNPQFAVSATA